MAINIDRTTGTYDIANNNRAFSSNINGQTAITLILDQFEYNGNNYSKENIMFDGSNLYINGLPDILPYSLFHSEFEKARLMLDPNYIPEEIVEIEKVAIDLDKIAYINYDNNNYALRYNDNTGQENILLTLTNFLNPITNISHSQLIVDIRGSDVYIGDTLVPVISANQSFLAYIATEKQKVQGLLVTIDENNQQYTQSEEEPDIYDDMVFKARATFRGKVKFNNTIIYDDDLTIAANVKVITNVLIHGDATMDTVLINKNSIIGKNIDIDSISIHGGLSIVDGNLNITGDVSFADAWKIKSFTTTTLNISNLIIGKVVRVAGIILLDTIHGYRIFIDNALITVDNYLSANLYIVGEKIQHMINRITN